VVRIFERFIVKVFFKTSTRQNDDYKRENNQVNITLLPGSPFDAVACGTICHRAFTELSDRHGFPPLFARPEAAIGLVSEQLSHPAYYSVIAELDGRVVGSSFLDERSNIAAIGPTSIEPDLQKDEIGRLLMRDVLERAERQRFTGVRLVQEAYNSESLPFYTRLGFEVREPLALMQGHPLTIQTPGYTVRPATENQLETCDQMSIKVHGHHRSGELLDAIKAGTATFVERDGRVTGYATTLSFFGHALGETNEDLKALIAATPEYAGPGFLLPTRNSELFCWCLESGFRVVSPFTLMSLGFYSKPKGVFLPSAH